MRAVNLIPGDARRRGPGGGSALPQAPAAVLIGLLAVALALVTAYVLTSNTISDRKAKIAEAQAQLAAAQAQAAKLTNYQQFASLAQTRAQTVVQVATSRFDWQAALADLSQVVPPNTSLQSLIGSVSPDASVSGSAAAGASAAGATTGTLRSAVQAPAFELSGCTKSQYDVSRLMSRLRVINGVTRVTLANSNKPAANTAGSTSVGSTGGSSQGCGANGPAFNLVVFFKPLPGATATSVSASTAPAGASSAPSPATSTTATTPTTPATSTTPATPTTPASSQPASGTSSSGGVK